MIFQDGNSKWFESLDDVRVEGFYAIPVTTIASFFKLKGRTAIISITNLEPYTGEYLLYSPSDKRYYIKTYREYEYNKLMDYLYSGEDSFINSLSNYIANGHIYLLYNADMVSDMKGMLARVYKTHFKKEGTLPYKLYIQVLEVSIKLEEYVDYAKAHTGYRTVISLMQEEVDSLWNQVKPKE
jgi:hypothetical protein